MTQPQPLLHCVNSTCEHPLNSVGRRFCQHCQTPLVYRYLWAVGQTGLGVAVGETLGDRYLVTSPQLWLDLQPGQPAPTLDGIPTPIVTTLRKKLAPYLHLYSHRLHVPEVFGVVWPPGRMGTESAIVLLENGPVDGTGAEYPAIAAAWSEATPVRQVYWLWQLLELWPLLVAQGVAASLLVAENVRVEGWRVRLRQLVSDRDFAGAVSLQTLGELWLPWALGAQALVTDSLRDLCDQMQEPEADLATLTAQLNRILLDQTAQLPLKLQVAGLTDAGPQRSHNEDACFPASTDLQLPLSANPDPLIPRLAIVCDGIGGHEGGEVASQLAVRILKLQVQALLTEIAEQPEPIEPEVLSQQLAAVIRVVNNLIASQNDAQGRSARQRMGTTLVMALQITQSLPGSNGGKAHELYLVNVGDSRAYWITPHYCHLLTVDDDVVAREVRLGRALRSEALQRSDATALTQGLGTKDAEALQPTVRRFMVEEDGLLLLCSDGLSDNGWVEQFWADYAEPVLKYRMTPTEAAQSLVKLANEKNGYDNVSVVLTCCRVSPESQIELFEPSRRASDLVDPSTVNPETELSEASQALLYDTEDLPEDPELVPPPAMQKSEKWQVVGAIALGIAGLIAVSGTIGLMAWRQTDRAAFDQWQRQFLKPWIRTLPTPSPSQPPLQPPSQP